ncbi:hypothetical protein D3C74_429430 [compost metagenome]
MIQIILQLLDKNPPVRLPFLRNAVTAERVLIIGDLLLDLQPPVRIKLVPAAVSYPHLRICKHWHEYEQNQQYNIESFLFYYFCTLITDERKQISQ